MGNMSGTADGCLKTVESSGSLSFEAMKTFAMLATVVNAIFVMFIFQNMHSAELRNVRKQHAAELDALQAEVDHHRSAAAMLYQILTQQEQGEQLAPLQIQ
jgi:hypothetical protein